MYRLPDEKLIGPYNKPRKYLSADVSSSTHRLLLGSVITDVIASCYLSAEMRSAQ